MMRSSNRIGEVVLGGEGTPVLTIEGLKTVSKAWATPGGGLRTSNDVAALDLSLAGLPAEVPPEVQDLLEAIEDGIDEILETPIANGGTIEIPGFGEISVGFDRQVERKRFAAASSFVLRVLLYGTDTVKGGGDDALVGIGRSWARINRTLPSAGMTGVGYGANTRLLDGVVTTGKLDEQHLPCPGTRGEVLRGPTAAIDFASAGQAVLEGLVGRASGEQSRDGRASAFTEGKVASIQLGPLEIRGIVGRVSLAQGPLARSSVRTSAAARSARSWSTASRRAGSPRRRRSRSRPSRSPAWASGPLGL